jgi:hypothetical protein
MGTTNNGVISPTRTGSGDPHTGARDAGIANSNKLSNLNSAARGGTKKRRRYSKKRRGGATIPVNTLTPIYNNSNADQGPQAQQISGAEAGNQAHVQGAGDDVPLVKGGKRRRNKSSRKTKNTKRRKLNSAKSRRKKRTTRRKRSTRSRR